MKGQDRRILVVAFADAQLTAYLVEAPRESRQRLDRLVHGLRALGRVAWHAWQLPPAWGPAEDAVAAVAGVVGRLVVDSVLASPPSAPDPAPAWLMPVWPFDHCVHGQPASTADLLGVTLELRAWPCSDEELGVALPGWPGRWALEASTVGAGA